MFAIISKHYPTISTIAAIVNAIALAIAVLWITKLIAIPTGTVYISYVLLAFANRLMIILHKELNPGSAAAFYVVNTLWMCIFLIGILIPQINWNKLL